MFPLKYLGGGFGTNSIILPNAEFFLIFLKKFLMNKFFCQGFNEKSFGIF
jgi:hypothetical protein